MLHLVQAPNLWVPNDHFRTALTLGKFPVINGPQEDEALASSSKNEPPNQTERDLSE